MSRNRSRGTATSANLLPAYKGDLFSGRGRAWLAKQSLELDERQAIEGWLAELDRLGVELASSDERLAKAGLGDDRVRRLMTISGINLTIAVGLIAAIGEVSRFSSPEKLVSYFGLNPRVRQSGDGSAYHGRISKLGRAHARALLGVVQQHPDGVTRGEILTLMGVKGDKSGEQSVSNALMALTKQNQLDRREGKYVPA
jgi:transposase